MTSAPYFSASHAIATEVSSPPEYARTIRFLTALSLHPLFELLRDHLRLAIAAADDEDRVLAADRADDVGKTGAIDRLGERLRLRILGPQHHQLLDGVEAPQRSG